MISCQDNDQLYKHLRQNCFTTVLFTLFEFICERPPIDIGIGIPNHGSIRNFIPLISDFGYKLNNKWDKIVVLYEDDLGMPFGLIVSLIYFL